MRRGIDILPECWDDYVYWELNDRNIIKRIHTLLKDIDRNGNVGIGKPEPLRHQYQGWWSRRITDEHRLVYRVDDDAIHILHCRSHYDD